MQPFFNETPKAHFIGHYPQLLEFYGGLDRFNTLRFERKHANVKRLIVASKNNRNLPFSLSCRHQEQQAILSLSADCLPRELAGLQNIAEIGRMAPPLAAAQHPFTLKANIIRRVIGHEHFIETSKFFLVNKEICLFGSKWDVDHDKAAEFSAFEGVVLPIKKTQEELSLSLAAVSHINNFKFMYNDTYFVNITV